MSNNINQDLPEFTCHICEQPITDVRIQKCKPQLVDGEVIFTDELYILTCETEDCIMCGQTLSHKTHESTTREQLLQRYTPAK